MINKTKPQIKNILERGVEDIIDKKNIEKKLRSGKKLRVKLGIDPTGPKIHLGRASQFWKLRAFQELGHTPVLIIGDFTALIGDASDKQSARKPLSKDDIRKNMRHYKKQLGKILDMDRVELRHNSEWLSKIALEEIISLAMNFTAQQVIHRRNFKERWDKEKPIGLHELLYPLLQGYDSVAIRADIEIGGFDQLFNLKAGRKIQEVYGQEPQDIMTSKMIYGLDGRKMSTSWGNVINIIDEPEEMYGKIMSMQDELMLDYLELCAFVPYGEIKEIKKKISSGALNPRDAKADLGRRIVSLYYNKEKAKQAAEHFDRVFRKKEIPENIEEVEIKEKEMNIIDLLSFCGLVSTRGEAKRLVAQKGVKINGKPAEDPRQSVKIKKGMVVQVGKRKFKKVK